MISPIVSSKIFLAFFTIAFISCSSCRKKPEADFILEKYEYSAGDMLEIKNVSLNQNDAEWTLTGNGTETQYKGKNPQIIIGMMAADGQYTLKLKAKSKGGKKSDETEKLLKVGTTRGNLTVNYQNGNVNYEGQKAYSVYIDGQLIGSETYYVFQENLPVGKRIVRLVSASKEQTYNVNISAADWTYIQFE